MKTVLDQVNHLRDTINRGEAYIKDAQLNLEAARVQLNDLAATFGIVIPEHLPSGPSYTPNGTGSGPYPLMPPDPLHPDDIRI